MRPKRKEIMAMMEKLRPGEGIKFKVPETFGGGVAIIALNPKPGKKYILKLGKDLAAAESAEPFMGWIQDKPKPMGKWVADRLGDLIE